MALDIKTAIKAHGLEVRTVADRMGITPTALSQHINGKRYKGKRVSANPSLEILQRIADAIGCDVVELFVPSKEKERPFTCPYCGKEITIQLNAK